MLIQLIIEDSIKHGLKNKARTKIINIRIFKLNLHIHIVVEDNGVGRKKAMKTTMDTVQGAKLINEMILLNQKIRGDTIKVIYTDLFHRDGKARGTEVEIIV